MLVVDWLHGSLRIRKLSLCNQRMHVRSVSENPGVYRGRWRTADNSRLGDNVEEPGSGRIGPGRAQAQEKVVDPWTFEWLVQKVIKVM